MFLIRVVFGFGPPSVPFLLAQGTSGQEAASYQVGLPEFQTFWEYLALLLCLCTFARRGEPIAVIGDNTASLQLALSLSGGDGLLAISRELSWRKARFGWIFAVGHLPTESNGIADALSRLTQHQRPPCLPQPLLGIPIWRPPSVAKLWKSIEGFDKFLQWQRAEPA